MQFKKSIFVIAVCMAVLGSAACSSDEPGNNGDTPANVALSVDKTSVEVPFIGGSADVTVTASAKPEAKGDQSWVTTAVAPTKNSNQYTVRITGAANEGTSARNASVTISCGKESKTVSVTQPGQPNAATNKAWDLAKKMHNGINIGNTLEAIGGETAWGAAPVNRDYIRGIKRAGFDCVRIPCSWEIYMDANQNIDQKWQDRVREVVAMCIDEGLYVILNDHWDGGWIENDIPNGYSTTQAAKLKNMWTQIATLMADFDDHLLLAGFNEPNAEKEPGISALLKYEQDFVDAVRATGGKNAERVLVIQAPNTSLELAHQYLTLPNDPAENCLMVEGHFYGPYQFVLMEDDADWSPTFWFWGEGNYVEGSNHNSTWGDEAWVREQCQLMYDKFGSKGIPCIMGEYGCMVRNKTKYGMTDEEYDIHQRSRRAWTACVVKESINAAIIPFNWDTPGGIINRKTGDIDDPAMVDAINTAVVTAKWPY